jgi:hypothetical protein
MTKLVELLGDVVWLIITFSIWFAEQIVVNYIIVKKRLLWEVKKILSTW